MTYTGVRRLANKLSMLPSDTSSLVCLNGSWDA